MKKEKFEEYFAPCDQVAVVDEASKAKYEAVAGMYHRAGWEGSYLQKVEGDGFLSYVEKFTSRETSESIWIRKPESQEEATKIIEELENEYSKILVVKISKWFFIVAGIGRI